MKRLSLAKNMGMKVTAGRASRVKREEDLGFGKCQYLVAE